MQYSGIDQVGHRGRHEVMYFKYTTLQPYTDCSTDAYNITVKLIGASDATWRQRTESTLAQVMAITWTNVDLSSVSFYGFHLRALPNTNLKRPTSKTKLKIIYLKLHSDFPGVNELNVWYMVMIYKHDGVSPGSRYGFLIHMSFHLHIFITLGE